MGLLLERVFTLPLVERLHDRPCNPTCWKSRMVTSTGMQETRGIARLADGATGESWGTPSGGRGSILFSRKFYANTFRRDGDHGSTTINRSATSAIFAAGHQMEVTFCLTRNQLTKTQLTERRFVLPA